MSSTNVPKRACLWTLPEFPQQGLRYRIIQKPKVPPVEKLHRIYRSLQHLYHIPRYVALTKWEDQKSETDCQAVKKLLVLCLAYQQRSKDWTYEKDHNFGGLQIC